MPKPFQSIAARLRTEVAAQRLEFDAGQLDAAERLDDLGLALASRSRSLVRQLSARWHAARGEPRRAPRGIYLWGEVGRGKTMLMDWFYAALTVPAQRTHFYRFMREVHAQLRAAPQRIDPLEAVAGRLARVAAVICLDEFFIADIADAMLLSGLLEGLFRRGVVLVATSNAAPQDLYRDGLQRQRFLPAIDLIAAHMTVLPLRGSIDHRLRQLRQAPTYLDSSLPGTAARMELRFAALAGDTRRGPATLCIEARPIAARDTGAGLVWFEFSEICEGARSQLDYIELARLYHTVFISEVPVFTRQDENAARRFIMLVDEFYDRNVKLVVAAAAAPAALYRGELNLVEFSRAASRLVEMQSEAYLAGRHRP